MATQAPYAVMRQLETEVKHLISLTDVQALDRTVQEQVRELKTVLTDARLELRDYEFAETRAEQVGHSKTVWRYLERVRELILATSQVNLFGPVDVAQLSATIDQLQAAVI